MNLDLVEEFIIKKHGAQKRIQGTPYYYHPMAVSKILADHGFNEDYLATGLCHDLLEDTDTSYEDIKKLCNTSVADAVVLLTKSKDYIMAEYMSGINNNDIAKMVKLADRLHNLSESHLANTNFKKKYIAETKKWYLDLAANTCFFKDINLELEKLEKTLI